MARSTVAIFEARRKVVDDELTCLGDEHQNIDRLLMQLVRRKEILDGRFELLVAERDLLDEKIWWGRRSTGSPRPPVVAARAIPRAPRDLARESWDFDELNAALAG